MHRHSYQFFRWCSAFHLVVVVAFVAAVVVAVVLVVLFCVVCVVVDIAVVLPDVLGFLLDAVDVLFDVCWCFDFCFGCSY